MHKKYKCELCSAQVPKKVINAQTSLSGKSTLKPLCFRVSGRLKLTVS